MVELYEESNAAINAMLSREGNILRIALTPALNHYGSVEVLSDFARQHPQYQMEITECPHVVELLTGQKCDFVFAMENDDIDSHMVKLLYKMDRLGVIFPASHPLASLHEVTLEQISRERFILHRNSSGEMQLETRKFLQLCKEAHIKPVTAANISSIPTIVKMVSQEQGVAILHKGQVPKESEGIFWADLVPPVQSHIYALYLNNKQMSAACRTFQRYLMHTIVKNMEETAQ